MKGDFSRFRVALVVLGVVAVALIVARRRVTLDADWNEQEELLRR
jgi:hypothetical protein